MTGVRVTVPTHHPKETPMNGTANETTVIPQTPGSLVSANVEEWGKVRRRFLFRRAYDPPWISHQDVNDRAYWRDEDLRDVTVLFDAASGRVS